MTFPTAPFKTPETVSRNALAESGNSSFWTEFGTATSGSGTYTIQEAGGIQSDKSYLFSWWGGPKTYNVEWGTKPTANAASLRFTVTDSVTSTGPESTRTDCNSGLEVIVLQNGRTRVYQKNAGGSWALLIDTTSTGMSTATRFALTVTPVLYAKGPRQFSDYITLNVFDSNGATLGTYTNTANPANFETMWRTWSVAATNYSNRGHTDGCLQFSVTDNASTETWELTHFSVINELNDGTHPTVFAPMPDGPVVEMPDLSTSEHPYLEWGYLNPYGAPFNCTNNDDTASAANQAGFLKCSNWAKAFSMRVGLPPDTVLYLEDELLLTQWGTQRTSRASSNFQDFIAEFNAVEIIGLTGGTNKAEIRLKDSSTGYTDSGTPKEWIIWNNIDYQDDPLSVPDNDNDLVITTRGAWADATAYDIGDVVTYSGTDYLCIYPHTSTLANDRPSTGTNASAFWATWAPRTGTWVKRPNSIYNACFENVKLSSGSNAGCEILQANAAQGSHLTLVDFDCTGGHTSLTGLQGAGGSTDSCTFTAGQYAARFNDTQPGMVFSGCTFDSQTAGVFDFNTKGGHTGMTLVGCHVEGFPAGSTMFDFNSSGAGSGANFQYGNVAFRDCSFAFASANAANKIVDGNRAVVFKECAAQYAAIIGTTTDGTTPYTVNGDNASGWTFIDEVILPTNPPVQSGGNLASLRTGQSSFSVTQTPDNLQYEAAPYYSGTQAVAAVDKQGTTGVAPTTAWKNQHKITDYYSPVDVDVAVDATKGDGVTDALSELDSKEATATTGQVIGVKPGMYMLSDTFTLGSGKHLYFGTRNTFLFPIWEPANGDPFDDNDATPRALLKLESGATKSVAQNVGAWVTQQGHNAFAWDIQGEYVIFNTHSMRRDGDGFGSYPGAPADRDSTEPFVQISGTGANGKFYTFNMGNGFKVAEGYSAFRVKDTKGGGRQELYGLNPEHVPVWPGCAKFENFEDIRVYGMKNETSYPGVFADDGRFLEITHLAGNPSAYIRSDINTTGWVPSGDTENETGYNPIPAEWPGGPSTPDYEPAIVILNDVVNYAIGQTQDIGRYQEVSGTFGNGTRPDGTSYFNANTAGVEDYYTDIYHRPCFIADGNWTPATLSAPTAGSVAEDAVTPSVSTSKPSGTIYGVLTADDDNPSRAQIKAGQDSLGNAAIASFNGAADSFDIVAFAEQTGLDSSTTYQLSFMQEDVNTSQSDVVRASFTTLAEGGGPPVTGTPKAGRNKGRRWYVVEIDGQDFVVGSAAEVDSLLAQAVDVLEQSNIEDMPARPKIRVKTVGGQPTKSKAIQDVLDTVEKKIDETISTKQVEHRVAQERNIDLQQQMLNELAKERDRLKDEIEALMALLL